MPLGVIWLREVQGKEIEVKISRIRTSVKGLIQEIVLSRRDSLRAVAACIKDNDMGTAASHLADASEAEGGLTALQNVLLILADEEELEKEQEQAHGKSNRRTRK